MRNGSKGIFCASSNDTGSVNANSTAAASQAARGMGDVYPVPHRVLARTTPQAACRSHQSRAARSISPCRRSDAIGRKRRRALAPPHRPAPQPIPEKALLPGASCWEKPDHGRKQINAATHQTPTCQRSLFFKLPAYFLSSPPTRGTNITGMMSCTRMSREPLVPLLTSTSVCVWKGFPTGITIRPPGLSCSISGGGM